MISRTFLSCNESIDSVESLSPTSVAVDPYQLRRQCRENYMNLQSLFAWQDLTAKHQNECIPSDYFDLNDVFFLQDMDRKYRSLGINRLCCQSSSKLNKSLCCVGKKISDSSHLRKSESDSSLMSNSYMSKPTVNGIVPKKCFNSPSKRQKYVIKLDPLETSTKRISRLHRNLEDVLHTSALENTSGFRDVTSSLSIEVPYFDFINQCPSPLLPPAIKGTKTTDSAALEDFDTMLTPQLSMARPHLPCRRNELPSLNPNKIAVEESI